MGREGQAIGAPVLNVVGDRVALGPIRKDLVPLYGRWVNDLETVRNLALTPGPMTEEKEEDWYGRQSRSESDMPFTIYERETLRPIGNTGLHDLDFRNGSASFGILIGEAGYRGRGLGTETTRLILDYGFTVLGLHNVMLTVFAFNPAGLKAYRKAGFREIGRRRQCRRMGGKFYDEIFMDCLASEFESPVLARIFSPT